MMIGLNPLGHFLASFRHQTFILLNKALYGFNPNRRLPGVMLIGLLSFSFVYAQDNTACTPADGAPIRIGAVFPQGTLLTVRQGEPYQGAQAMLDAINACGGINGHPVEWIYIPADDREEAEAAARVLIADEDVPLIVGSGSVAVSERLEEIANAEAVVFWEVTEALPGHGGWAFTPRPDNRRLGGVAAAFAANILKQTLGLDELRVALVYEDRPRGRQIAAGIRAALPQPVSMEQKYSNDLWDTYGLAVQMRESRINVVMLVAFNNDADRLWSALRQADANIAAWIHVGAEGYRDNLCQRYGNTDGIISVSPTGPVSEAYREAVIGEIYRLYRRNYMRANSTIPTPRADLSASGVYLLLAHLFPEVRGDYSAENIRQAIIETDIGTNLGLMGEGLSIDPQTGINQYSSAIIQQRQDGRFCSNFPPDIATCAVPVVTFPTWRERAIKEESEVCSDSA